MDVIYYILFLLLFLIICSIFFKNIEGFDDKFYYDKLIDYKTIPNSYVNDSTPSRTINKFGFYKGEGTFKKGYSAETKSDEKISTLNKLLNRLLGRIVSDNNDCVGEFGKYSECDKSCGSNSYQTRTYNVSQERGQNGLDCAFEDGYKEKKRCGVDQCQLGDICENNADCGTGNCRVNSTRCENMVPCDTKNVHVCDEDECIKLNDNDAGNNDNDNVKMLDGVYIYNNVDEECFFKTPAEIEELNLNIYTYDYRTISEQVKNLVLDCKYYQVKKDGVGPCINASNITMEGGVAKCKLGFGPQPTMFNGSDVACTKCLIKNDDGTYKGNDKCVCGPGKIPEREESTYTCVPYTAPPGNVCSDVADDLYFVKFSPPSISGEGVPSISGEGAPPACQSCPENTAFKKEGSNISCIPCAESAGSKTTTLSSKCPPGSCSRFTELIKQNLTYFPSNSIEPGTPSNSIETGQPLPYSYQEECVITAGDDALANYDRCPLGAKDPCTDEQYVCHHGYKGNKCQTPCSGSQVGCAESGDSCLNPSPTTSTDNMLVCLLPESGYYVTGEGVSAPCTIHPSCAEYTWPPECVEGTQYMKCLQLNTLACPTCALDRAGEGVVTDCSEYGAFFPIVGEHCIGACQHGGTTVPGNVATEWKYKPGKDTDGPDHGCPIDSASGAAVPCSPAAAGLSTCRECGTRTNIETLSYIGGDAVAELLTTYIPEGYGSVTKDGRYYKFMPGHSSSVEVMRWDSPCIHPDDDVINPDDDDMETTTFSTYLESAYGAQFNFTDGDGTKIGFSR